MGMNIGLAVLAAGLALVGALLLWWRSRMGGEIALMAATQTSKAADVSRMAPGTLVEIKGILRCPALLTGEYSQQPCAYYRSEMTCEEVYYDRDSEGKSRRNTRTTTVYSSIKHAPCRVEDDSGSVALDMDGADVEAVQSVSRVANPGTAAMTSLLTSIGGVGNSNTYREIEFVLAPDIPVYLLGEVQQDGSIGKPAHGSANKKFVVSHKSEEERTKDIGSTMTYVFWSAIVLFACAVAALVWAFVRGPA